MLLNTLPIGSGTCMIRCCLVGGSVSLWEEALKSHMVKLCPVWDMVYILLPVGQDVQLSTTSPAPYLLSAALLSAMTTMD